MQHRMISVWLPQCPVRSGLEDCGKSQHFRITLNFVEGIQSASFARQLSTFISRKALLISLSIVGALFTLVSLSVFRGERVLVISGWGAGFKRRSAHATTQRAGYASSLIYGVHNAMAVVGSGPAK